MKEIELKEYEQRILHLGAVETLKKRVQELEKRGREEGTLPPNKRGFWHLSWKCLACRDKTDAEGRWKCGKCGLVQLNGD